MLPVILVHGYKYDPAAINDNNPHTTLFKEWRKQLGDFSVIDHGWFSVPMGLPNLFKAWSNGYVTRYRWAWNLAKNEADNLVKIIDRVGPCNMIAHSLGTRVALQTIKKRADIRTAILLNGAEYSSTAANIAEHSTTDIHNMYVHEDDVLLNFGRLAPPLFGEDIFIGQAGLGMKVNNWKDYQLDSKEIREWGKQYGYDLAGDNPKKLSDHKYSYTWLPNWDLYRDILTK